MAHRAQGQSHASKLSIAEHQALVLGVDDLFGLWELRWTLREQFPHDEDGKLIDVAAKALKHLIDEGFVRVVRWDPHTDREEDLSVREMHQAVADVVNWEVPASETELQLRFIATEAGERFYYEHQDALTA